MEERKLYPLIAQYLQLHYPDVVYRFDLAADLKLTYSQAKRHKTIHPLRGYPDLFIAKPVYPYGGLFLELKKDGASVLKKDGTLKKDDHLQEQFNMLKRLIEAGYKANFAIGYEDTIKQIENYLHGNSETL